MSRAGQFNESRAHQRRAGRAGGFGGGGGLGPEPGDCLLALAGAFMYDWETGQEILWQEGRDYHLYTFDKLMNRMSFEYDGISQLERDDGYGLWGGFNGGSGVYWAYGRRWGTMVGGGGRYQAYDVGYICNAFGVKQRRYDLDRQFQWIFEGDPKWDWSRFRYAWPGGSSGAIGNLQFPTMGVKHLAWVGDGTFEAVDPWHGLAHLATGTAQRDDFRLELPPEMTWFKEYEDGRIFWTFNGWGNNTSRAGGSNGFLLFGHNNGVRWQYTPDTFTIIPGSLRDREEITEDSLLDIIGPGFDRVSVLYQTEYQGEQNEGYGPSWSSLKGGKDFTYYPFMAHRVDGGWPPNRIGIAREFTDWDGVFGKQGRRVWHSVGWSDRGTQKEWYEPNAPVASVAGD